MNANLPLPSRAYAGFRGEFLRKLAVTPAFFTAPGLFAEQLTRKTPWVEKGPFYPPKLPLDTDNDLIIVKRFDYSRGGRNHPSEWPPIGHQRRTGSRCHH